jgi:hypothetical protein
MMASGRSHRKPSVVVQMCVMISVQAILWATSCQIAQRKKQLAEGIDRVVPRREAMGCEEQVPAPESRLSSFAWSAQGWRRTLPCAVLRIP